jgi:hypothetical protein
MQQALATLKSFPAFVAVSSAEGLRDMIRAVFSHVWAQSKQITAVTPKGVYLPLLAMLWKFDFRVPDGHQCPAVRYAARATTKCVDSMALQDLLDNKLASTAAERLGRVLPVFRPC